MTNKLCLMNLNPRAGRLTCHWVPTGDPKMPLTCVWIQTSASRTVSTASSADETGRMHLCA